MLPRVVEFCSKRKFHQDLMDYHLLVRFRDWLDLLPDGSLPNRKVRFELYRLCEMLPVTTDSLSEAEGFGELIMQLWLKQKDDAEEGKVLRALIEKWLRPIFNRTTDYRELKAAEMRRADELRREFRRPVTKVESHKALKRARVPKKAFHDYLVRPQSQVDVGAAEDEERELGGPTRFQRLEKRLKKKPTQAAQARVVSLTGKKSR
eukprot:GABV01001930.1.p1 GENE.GABV01001930.1~~GABV01001930.1.p1  ORF type:complete len:206 (-),score=31.38 GABV01001930.1:46-663(-)